MKSKKLYLILWNITAEREFKKYFDTEEQMDKYLRRLKYSTNLELVKDSREDLMWYE